MGHTRASGALTLGDDGAMTGIQFVIDERGRKVAVLTDLKKHEPRLQDLWDGVISESRRKGKRHSAGEGQGGSHQTQTASWVVTQSRSQNGNQARR